MAEKTSTEAEKPKKKATKQKKWNDKLHHKQAGPDIRSFLNSMPYSQINQSNPYSKHRNAGNLKTASEKKQLEGDQKQEKEKAGLICKDRDAGCNQCSHVIPFRHQRFSRSLISCQKEEEQELCTS